MTPDRDELSVGQGVYGSLQSLPNAGAETLVTSLWQVSDAATGKLMTLRTQPKATEGKEGAVCSDAKRR